MRNINYYAFPDIVYEGEIPLSVEFVQGIKNDVYDAQDNQLCIAADFGWATTPKTALGSSLRKLQRLIGAHFISTLSAHVKNITALSIQVIEPVIFNIMPGQTVLPLVETRRWYTGCTWLQTTDTGSHLRIDAPVARIHATPKGIATNNIVVSPADFKYVFWPSHLSAGFTQNKSMTDTKVLWFSFKTV